MMGAAQCAAMRLSPACFQVGTPVFVCTQERTGRENLSALWSCRTWRTALVRMDGQSPRLSDGVAPVLEGIKGAPPFRCKRYAPPFEAIPFESEGRHHGQRPPGVLDQTRSNYPLDNVKGACN